MSKEAAATTSEKKILNVYEAIASVQGDLAQEGISKDRKNKEQGYSFRGIDDVYNALAPLLSKYRLCILPEVESREEKKETSAKGTALFHVIVRSKFTFVSAQDGSSHQVVTYGQAMDSADKATNKAMSAAYKYACLQTFCIPTEGDNDADGTSHEVKANAGVFESKEALDRFVENTISAINKAETLAQVKDQRDLNAARLEAMKSSPSPEDRDGVKKIIAAQNAVVSKLQAQPKTVEGAKAALPEQILNDEIPF